MALADMTASRGWVEAQLAQLQSTLNSSIALKQNTLVAGSGVTIEGSVISATADLSSVMAEITVLQSQLLGKQAALTAGTGITISGNVISATGSQPDVDKAYVDAKVASLTSLVNTKQGQLTAGRGIVLEGNLISLGDLDLSAYALTQDLADLRTLVGTKQGTLTAGAGISIADGVISATFPSLSSYATSAQLSAAVASLETAIAQAQPNLTAGTGISIQNGVISCTVTADGGVAQSYVDGEIERLEEAIRGKQATLSAGTGITIVNGVISSTAVGGVTQDYVDQAIASVEDLLSGKRDDFSVGSGLLLENGTLSVVHQSLSEYVLQTDLDSAISGLRSSLSGYQTKLTSGTGISLNSDGTISVDSATVLSGYATESYVDSAIETVNSSLSAKQNVLTAGDNVTISEDKISVTFPSLAGYVTIKDLNESINAVSKSLQTYQQKLTSGSGISITQDGTISCTVDTSGLVSSATFLSRTTELSDLIATKQESLVAGSGITIVGNVISSSLGIVDYVSANGQNAVSARGVYDYLTTNYVSSSSLSTQLSSYATTAALSSATTGMATQSWTTTQLSAYLTATGAAQLYRTAEQVRQAIEGYGYATTTSLAAMQSSIEQTIQSAIANVQAGMTYRGSVKGMASTMASLPSTGVISGDRYWVNVISGTTGGVVQYNGSTWDTVISGYVSGDMYWVENLGSGSGGFRIVDANGIWSTISLGGGGSSGGISSSVFTAHTTNQNAEKHVTATDISTWNAMTPLSTYNTHVSSTGHITSSERTSWTGAVTGLSTHVADTIKHLTQAEHTALTTILNGGGTGGSVITDDSLDPSSGNAVANSAVTPAIDSKQDAVTSNVDLRKVCTFDGAAGLFLLDENGVVVGIVTNATTTNGTDAIANEATLPPLSRLDLTLFRRGVLSQGPSRNDSDPIFDNIGSKSLSGTSGLMQRTVGSSNDPNSVKISFRLVPGDASRYSASRYPISDNATSNKPWDIISCNLSTGAVTLYVGGNSATYPTAETHTLKWKGNASGSYTVPVRMLSGTPIAGVSNVDQTPTSGNRSSLVTSHGVAEAIQTALQSVSADPAINAGSTNPVQNKAVAEALAGKLSALTYKYTEMQTVENGSVTYSEDFSTTPYNGVSGTVRKNALGSFSDISSGSFLATLSYKYSRSTNIFSQRTLTVTDGSALAALSPNPNATAASYQRVTTVGQTSDIGSVYAHPSLLKVVVDRVRYLSQAEDGIPAGAFVWEFVNFNDSTDHEIFAYLVSDSFPKEAVVKTGTCAGELTNEPDLAASDRMVSSAGIAKALKGYVESSALRIPDRSTVTEGSVSVLLKSAYVFSKATDSWSLYTDHVSGTDVSVDTSVKYHKTTGVIEQATVSLGPINILRNYTPVFNLPASTFEYNSSIEYTKRTINLRSIGGSENEGCVIGTISTLFNAYNKTNVRITSYDPFTYTCDSAIGSSTRRPSFDVVLFPQKTDDFDPGTIIIVSAEDDESKQSVSIAAGWCMALAKKDISSGYYVRQESSLSNYPGYMLKANLVLKSAEYASYVTPTGVDIEPSSDGETKLVTSAGVAKYIKNTLSSDSVSLGHNYGTGNLYFHGYKLLDSAGHIPVSRLDLGFKSTGTSQIYQPAGTSFGCVAYWNGKYFKTDGSTSFYEGGGSTIEHQGADETSEDETIPPTAGHSIGGYISYSTTGGSWTQVTSVGQFAAVNNIITDNSFLAVVGSGTVANGNGTNSTIAKIAITFDGTTWYNATFDTTPHAPRILWMAYDPATSTFLASGAGNSGNPNGSCDYYYTSSNGKTWTERTLAEPFGTAPRAYFCGMWRAGNYWFASTQHSSSSKKEVAIWRSSNAISWTNVFTLEQSTDGIAPDHIYSLAYADGKYIFATTKTHSESINGIWTSENGYEWTRANIIGATGPVSIIVNGITKFNDLWIAIGTSYTGLLVSRDGGSTWQEMHTTDSERIIPMPTKKSRANHAYAIYNGMMYIPVKTGGYVYSNDGLTWYHQNIGSSSTTLANEVVVTATSSAPILFLTFDNKMFSSAFVNITVANTFDKMMSAKFSALLTFDTLPQEGSGNAVTSAGIKKYCDDMTSSITKAVANLETSFANAISAILGE